MSYEWPVAGGAIQANQKVCTPITTFLWLFPALNQYGAGLVYVFCGFMAEGTHKVKPAVVLV